MTADLASLDPVRRDTDPPDGWYTFGTHAGWDNVPELEFQGDGGAGMPLFERPYPWPKELGEAIIQSQHGATAWIKVKMDGYQVLHFDVRTSTYLPHIGQLSDRIERALYVHRERGLVCMDHGHDPNKPVWCCTCGQHELTVSWRKHVAEDLARDVLTDAPLPTRCSTCALHDDRRWTALYNPPAHDFGPGCDYHDPYEET